MEGCDTETTGVAANRCRSLKDPCQLQRRFPKNEKHEMEIEIEKVAKAQKEAHERKQDNEQHASYAKECVAKVEVEFHIL